MNTHPAIKLTFQSSYVSIQILFLKGIKTWIRRSLKVLTWLGYKRNVICGAIEIKKTYQRGSFLVFLIKNPQPFLPINSNLRCLHMIHFDLDNLFYFWFFLSFSFCIYNTTLFWSKIKLHHCTWHRIYLLSLPNLNQQKPYLNVPLF